MQDHADAAALGFCPERLERIDGWMRRLVETGRLAGLSVTVARAGRTAFSRAHGLADLARGTPFTADTVTRIYSMTKPLTSVAVMQLYEEGRFQLDDPIARFLPEFSDMRVATGGNRAKIETEPARRPITWRDLLTHTAGLTYGFMDATLVDALYRLKGADFLRADSTLAEVTRTVAGLPLLAQPGAAWNYSVATDVLGRLVEVVSGLDFADYLRAQGGVNMGRDYRIAIAKEEARVEGRYGARDALAPVGVYERIAPDVTYKSTRHTWTRTAASVGVRRSWSPVNNCTASDWPGRPKAGNEWFAGMAEPGPVADFDDCWFSSDEFRHVFIEPAQQVDILERAVASAFDQQARSRAAKTGNPHGSIGAKTQGFGA